MKFLVLKKFNIAGNICQPKMSCCKKSDSFDLGGTAEKVYFLLCTIMTSYLFTM